MIGRFAAKSVLLVTKFSPLVLLQRYMLLELSKPPVTQPGQFEIESVSESALICDQEPVLSRRIVRFGLIWGVWTIVALFFSTQVYVMYYSEKQPIPWRQGFLVQASACYLWALATPLVLWLSRRFCIERHNLLRRLGLHFLFSLGLVSTLLALHFVIYMPLIGRASLESANRLAAPGRLRLRLIERSFYGGAPLGAGHSGGLRCGMVCLDPINPAFSAAELACTTAGLFLPNFS